MPTQGSGKINVYVGGTPPSQGQSAVALTPVDGEYISGSTQSNFIGDGFWSRKGFSVAANWVGPNPLGGNFAGFDDPNFLLLMAWLSDYEGNYSRFLDLGLNGQFPCDGSVVLDNVAANGTWVTVNYDEHTSGSLTTGQKPYVVGVNCGEEPSTQAEYETIISRRDTWFAGADGPGRFHEFNHFRAVLNGDIDHVYDPADMVIGATIAEPTPPKAQITACDVYFFAGAPIPGGQVPVALGTHLYAGGSTATTDQTARGCHYGSMIDSMRKQYPVGSVYPSFPWIENGAPYQESNSAEITPAQVAWGIWAMFVHGCRGIAWFDHTFRTGDPNNGSNNNFANNYYGGPGITGNGIYAKAKQLMQRALALAPVINSPFDGYFVYGDMDTGGAVSHSGFLTAVTSTNARTKYGGVDACCRWQPGEAKHYILATTRESESATDVPVTFRMVDQGQISAHELHEDNTISISRGGAIPAGYCEFSDTFALASDYKVYGIT